jgi:hypothetical protein
MEKTTQNKINFTPFFGIVNAYLFSWMNKSITGRLIGQTGEYLTIQTKSGSIVVAHVDTLRSIWHIRQKNQEVV